MPPATRLGTLLLIGLTAPALMPSAAEAADVTGLWITGDGKAAVEIERCGESRCGRIVGLQTPFDAVGRPVLDVKNPSASERRLPLCGARIIRDLQRQDDGSWDDGTLYDPQQGKSYRLMVKPQGSNRLEVRGYLGVRSIREVMIWTRGAAHLKRCQSETASNKAR